MMMSVVPIVNGASAYLVESRKRPLEEAVELGDYKRERQDMDEASIENGMLVSGPPPGQLLLKILIPGYAAGAVIGKGGQIIVQLQKESGAIIKLSKAKDFYPGTQDRVVLIQGNAEGLIKVHNTIIEKVYEFPVPKDLAAIIGDRPKQVKIIVPNTTAGLVIGKGGVTIKTIMEESGSKVQLSQKPDGVNVQERVITIKGEKHQLMAASNIIIDKIKDDPQSASCPHISYAGIQGPVANANPTGSPYAAGQAIVDQAYPSVAAMLGHYVFPGQPQVVQAALPTLQHAGIPAHSPAPNGDLQGLNASALTNYTYGINYNGLGMMPGVQNLHAGIATSVGMIPSGSLAGTVSPIQPSTPLLSAAYPGETAQAMHAAAVPGGISHAQAVALQNNYLTSLGYLTNSHPQIFGAQQAIPAGATLSQVTQQHHQALTPTSLAVAAAAPSPPVLQTNFVPQGTVSLLSVEKSSDGQKETIDLSIPENLIGAILGKAGRTLVEYQDISGAKIQISKKGEYVAGTRNRRVTITGKPSSSQTAQFLITQRISAAQSARAQQAKLI